VKDPNTELILKELEALLAKFNVLTKDVEELKKNQRTPLEKNYANWKIGRYGGVEGFEE
jgi:hypothetical protein